MFLPLACQQEENKKTRNMGEIEKKFSHIASEHKIPKNFLLTAAYTQSNFGVDKDMLKEEVSLQKREPYYGIRKDEIPAHINPDSDSALYELTEHLASKIRILSEERKKGNPNWFDLIAEVIVGNEGSDKSLKHRMTLKPMIQNYNDGFKTYLGNDVIILKPSTQPLPDSFYINSEKTFKDTLKANSQEKPQILLRFCKSNALICYENFKDSPLDSKIPPAHFMVFKSFENEIEELSLDFDKREESPNENTPEEQTVVIVAGNAGLSANGYDPHWLNWKSYYALGHKLKEILNYLKKDNQYTKDEIRESIKDDIPLPPLDLNIAVYEKPQTWDSSLFFRTLDSSIAPKNAVDISSPLDNTASKFTNKASIEINLDIANKKTTPHEILNYASKIHIYADDPFSDDAWSLVINHELIPQEMTLKYKIPLQSHGIKNKSSNVRFLKINILSKTNELLGSHILDFKMKNLK